MDFATRFAELRADNDIKQKDLAKLLNVSVSAISHYEKGLNIPDLESLILLAKHFNVSLDYLVGRSSQKEVVIALSEGSISSGEVLDLLLSLAPDQRNDIVRHLRALTSGKK